MNKDFEGHIGFPFFEGHIGFPFIKYIFFIFLWTIFLATFLYSQTKENLDENFKLVYLLFSILFLIFALKQESGCSNLQKIYTYIGIKGGLNQLLSFLPMMLFLSYVVIALWTMGKVIVGFLINLSMVAFVVPIIIGIVKGSFDRMKKKKEVEE